MKRKLSVYPLLILFTVLIFAGSSDVLAQDKKYDTILGIWDIEADVDMEVMNFVVTFSMEGDSIKGKFESDMFGESDITNIKLDGESLTYDLVLADGMSVSTECTVNKDEVEGTFYADAGTADFTGTRRKGGNR
ncbi:MAG: hypothetical protein GY863_22140 [bacterium]|nr:hypothetical protein [bacterium]